jgi:hypothetical protein
MSNGTAIFEVFAGTMIAAYGLLHIYAAMRRGKTILRGHEIYRNADSKDFWMVILGDVIVLAFGVTLLIRNLYRL